MGNKELFELLKKNHSLIKDIENPTDEMKDYLIEEKSMFIPFLKDLTESQMNRIVELGYYRISVVDIDWSKISEESVLKGVKNSKDEFSQFIHTVLSLFPMTDNLAKLLSKKNLLWANDERIKSFLDEKDIEEAVDVFLQAHISEDKNYRLNIVFPKVLPITEKQWQFIIDNEIFEDEFLEREDLPQEYRYKYIDSCRGSLWSEILENLNWMDAIYWVEHYLETRKNDIKDIFKNLKKDDMVEFLKRKPECIKYIRTPKVYECIAAIEGNPMSIQYIENPTQTVIKKALELNPKVESVLNKNNENVCKVLGISKFIPTKKYPATMYLVTFDEDLCDEDNLVKVMVVKGKDMESFMKETFTLSFGNLYDGEPRLVKDCVTYKPIHQDELKVLEKFGLDDIESGYFDFDCEDEEDSYDEEE